MALLVFRHVPFEDLGMIAPALEGAGLAYSYVDAFRWDVSTIRPGDGDAFVFMGGPMSANDTLGFIQSEIDLIRGAVELGKPVLGICLGAQLIARALGAQVYPNPVREIGWYPVWWTDKAADDPLFSGLSQPELVFHWHGETFDLPEGAVWLAYSEHCRHQAFRYGTATYGIQFHLEITPEMIMDWLTEPDNQADVEHLRGTVDPFLNSSRLRELATKVFGAWARLVRVLAEGEGR